MNRDRSADENGPRPDPTPPKAAIASGAVAEAIKERDQATGDGVLKQSPDLLATVDRDQPSPEK